MARLPTQTNTPGKALLYVLVFEYRPIKFVVATMFAFFFLQPALPAFAADEEAVVIDGTSVAEEAVTEPEPEPAAEVAEEVAGESVTLADTTETEQESSAEADTGSTTEPETPADSDVATETELGGGEENASEEVAAAVDYDEEVMNEQEPDVNAATSSDSNESLTSSATTTPVTTASSTSETDTGGLTNGGSGSSGSGEAIEDVAGTATTTDEVSTSTTTEDVTVVTPEVEEDAATSTTDVTEETVSDSEDEEVVAEDVRNPDEETTVEETTEVASSTTEVIYVVQETTTDLNRHTFAEDECVSVGDGSYYCSQSTSVAAASEDGVYAERDEVEGDHEIYLRQGEKVTRLTDNSYEDRSPSFDPQTETVVFHRLIEGRYQIFSVNADGSNETQLTSEHTNHMEPSRSGDVTVWQEWIGENWEIVALIDGEREQLTDNDRHDVAPTIRDGYIMWHVTNSDGDKLLSVYEIETGITSDIADPDGGQVENPRFVLVYDTKFENGDLITKTFDPETGEVRPVGSEPAPLPALPDPEPTGEESAIIQNKSSNKSEAEEAVDDLINTFKAGAASSSPTSDDEATHGATTTSEMFDESVDLGGDVDMSEAATSTLPLTEFDLIVEPYNATSSAQSTDSASSSDSVE